MSLCERVENLLQLAKDQDVVRIFEENKARWINKIQQEVRKQNVAWIWQLALDHVNEWKLREEPKKDDWTAQGGEGKMIDAKFALAKKSNIPENLRKEMQVFINSSKDLWHEWRTTVAVTNVIAEKIIS